MATQFRDTAFGHLVRLVSNNRLLQNPDEIDPTLWKKSFSGSDASSKNTNGSPRAKTNGPKGEASDGTVRDSSGPAHMVEGGKNIHLMDWYGPDDPDIWR